MVEIAIIGAGSSTFTEAMIRDSLTFPALSDASFRLMDTDPDVLGPMETLARNLIALGDHPATVATTTDRREALDGADYVIVSILVGGVEPFDWEIDIPLRYGVDQSVGDTMGPAGIFRAARTIPAMIEIARDMEQLCPDAPMLNYTNPMSMLCEAVREASDVAVVGLCHSVQGAHQDLARVIGAAPEDCASWMAGINHQAWVLDYRHNGQDAYPRIRRAARENQDWWDDNTIRVEMLRQLGYYVTESSAHNSEYNPWFRKRKELKEKYTGDGWSGGTGFIRDEYKERYPDRIARMKKQAEDIENLRTERGQEYGTYIINAMVTGEPFRFNGTVANTGLITNLPRGCSVEVPCYADRSGVHPCYVGELPPHLAALNSMVIRSTSMAVQAVLRGDKELLYHSILYDPLTAAALGMNEIREMVDEMYEKEKHLMPTFRD